MESKFECFVPYTAPVTRELVLSLSTQLRRLAEREHGANETDISSGITLFCGADAMRFSSEEELAARKARWVCPEPKIKTGYLARYAKMVSSADKGAILE